MLKYCCYARLYLNKNENRSANYLTNIDEI